MLVIKIEMWPRGDATRAKEIERAYVWNDDTGDLGSGNYDVILCKARKFMGDRPWTTPRQMSDRDVWRTGHVHHFDRSKSTWLLLLLALKSALIGSRAP